MSTEVVKTAQQMAQANRLFQRRLKSVESSILYRLAKLDEKKSKEIAENVKFTGALIATTELTPLAALKFQVITSAPHAYDIEKGIAPNGPGEYVYFNEAPLLVRWVREKLRSKDPRKAAYFMKIGAVKVGAYGYPYGYPTGLRFREQGFLYAVDYSDKIIVEELSKLA